MLYYATQFWENLNCKKRYFHVTLYISYATTISCWCIGKVLFYFKIKHIELTIKGNYIDDKLIKYSVIIYSFENSNLYKKALYEIIIFLKESLFFVLYISSKFWKRKFKDRLIFILSMLNLITWSPLTLINVTVLLHYTRQQE